MGILLACLAGLPTLITACVLPVLPIILASSLQADRRAPLALAAGMSVSFVTLGLGVAAIGPALGITEDVVSRVAALFTAGFALGVSTLILALGFGARGRLGRNLSLMRRLAQRSKPILGATFLLVGVALWFRVHHAIDAWMIEHLPARLIDLSVSVQETRLIDRQGRNRTIAARATADRKTLGHLSWRVAIGRRSVSLPNMISNLLRRL